VLDRGKSKLLIELFLIASILLISTPALATSETMLELLKILRDNDSLSNSECNLLYKTATAENEQMKGIKQLVKKEIKEEIVTINKNSEWTNKIKLNGDMRLRYEWKIKDGSEDRSRGRIRYHLAVITKPLDKLEVSVGLASGGGDLRSTNQSFDITFSAKGINLDYVYYAQYKFNDNLVAITGKFKRKPYLWQTTDLMWDSDINPEGLSVNYTSPNELGTTFVNGGLWVLEENSGSEDDPYMMFGQLGHKFSSGNVYGTVAGTYYSFSELNALGDIVTDGSNTDYQFDSMSLSGEVGLKNAFGSGAEAALFADFVKNTDTDTAADTGYSLGFKIGKSAWDFKYIYVDLEANAWLDILPDSDRFDGLTGVDGHEFIFNYDLMKNLTFGLDYYNIDNALGVKQDVIQVDVLVKF